MAHHPNLPATAATFDGLVYHVQRWLCEQEPPVLHDDGSITRADGSTVAGVRWLTRGSRYRFELT